MSNCLCFGWDGILLSAVPVWAAEVTQLFWNKPIMARSQKLVQWSRVLFFFLTLAGTLAVGGEGSSRAIGRWEEFEELREEEDRSFFVSALRDILWTSEMQQSGPSSQDLLSSGTDWKKEKSSKDTSAKVCLFVFFPQKSWHLWGLILNNHRWGKKWQNAADYVSRYRKVEMISRSLFEPTAGDELSTGEELDTENAADNSADFLHRFSFSLCATPTVFVPAR